MLFLNFADSFFAINSQYLLLQFVLIKEQLVEFNQIAIEHANGHEDMLNRIVSHLDSVS